MIAPDFPEYLQIETVAVCIARCTMCLVQQCKRGVPLMTEDLFQKIAGELQPHTDRITRLTIQAAGEPLIDSRLEQRIQDLKQRGIRSVSFATNGLLMNRDRAKTILQSGVDEVDFSVDGVTKETYERIRRGLNFDHVVQNIHDCIDVRNASRAKTRIRIRMTVQQANQHELASFLAYWGQYLDSNDHVYAKHIHTWGNNGDLKELPDSIDYDLVNKTICEPLWKTMLIFADGRVPLCTCDANAQYCAGNAANQTIEQIWGGNLFQEMRQRHLDSGRQALEMCRNCIVWADEAQISASSASPSGS